MKKTFVILLIMVCVSFGLFAVPASAAAQLIINADVGANNIIKVTDQEYVFTTYEALAALDDTVTSSTVINAGNYKNASVVVGYLNYFTNHTAGLGTAVEATPLASGANEISYYVLLDGDQVAYAKADNGEGGYEPPTIERVELVGSSTDVYRHGSKAISISVDPDEFDSACRGSRYSGTITFSYYVD